MDTVWPKIFAYDNEKGIVVKQKGKKIYLLESVPNLNVKPLYNALPVFCLDVKDVVCREVEVPITKGQDFETTLNFLCESFLPYPLEEALIERQIKSKSKETISSTVFITRKEKASGIIPQPEGITSAQAAILSLSSYFILEYNRGLIFYLEPTYCSILYIENGFLIKAATCTSQINDIQRLLLYFKTKCEIDFNSATILGKLSHNETFLNELENELKIKCHLPVLKNNLCVDVADVQKFAPLIGSALNFLPKSNGQINFLRERFLFKRLKNRLALFFALSLAAASALFFYFNTILAQEIETQEMRALNYLAQKNELLGTNKELENPIQTALQDKLVLFPYPLKTNTLNTTAFLSWLNDRATISGVQFEKIKYTFVKMPSKKEPKNPYLPFVELEFKTETKESAKKLKEALCDQKEFKYSEYNGLYKMSFFL